MRRCRVHPARERRTVGVLFEVTTQSRLTPGVSAGGLASRCRALHLHGDVRTTRAGGPAHLEYEAFVEMASADAAHSRRIGQKWPEAQWRWPTGQAGLRSGSFGRRVHRRHREAIAACKWGSTGSGERDREEGYAADGTFWIGDRGEASA
jgi:hypothetical protein